MTWIVWLLVVWNLLGIMATIFNVGKDRGTLTPATAAGGVLATLIQIALILLIGGIL